VFGEDREGSMGNGNGSGREAPASVVGSSRFETSPSVLLRAGAGFRLEDVDPDATPGFSGTKEEGSAALLASDGELDALQERLFAASRVGARDSLLLILQAMDTAGKGGIVRHVMGSVDPQGIHHHAFKAPTDEERAHDFLWRVERELPEAGIIGVFDRSHYEDVLVQRVRGLCAPEEIERRYAAIREFEDLVDEQRDRLLERLDRPDKHWKFSPGDIDERRRWDDYMEAYRIAIERTRTDDAPWYVVPANKKWYARIAVQQLLIDALHNIDPQWPAPAYDVEEQRRRLAQS
jgi:PPK2 family polyphosphate:nucleotide phosphotransferase